MEYFRLQSQEDDPAVMITVPKSMLMELEHRAFVNGRHLNTQILIFLARGLESKSFSLH